MQHLRSISLNPGFAAYVADHVAVLQAGRIVEQGLADDVLQRPQHDYTQTLLAPIPRVALTS